MNGSGSIQFLPPACFLSDAFVVFLQKVAAGHFSMFQPLHRSKEFLERGSSRHAVTGDLVGKGCKGKAAAGARTPLAGKHFADFLLTFAAVFFFPWDLNFAA